MNETVARAIEQLKEARETLHRSLDDPTLSMFERKTLWDAYYGVHDISLTLSLAKARSL